MTRDDGRTLGEGAFAIYTMGLLGGVKTSLIISGKIQNGLAIVPAGTIA